MIIHSLLSMRLPNIGFFALAALGLLYLTGALPAQHRIQTFLPDTAPSQNAAENDSEREQTIARALEDLATGNEDLRVGAVMLLGKYRDPRARSAVIEAVEDPAVRVRRAAVVSLLEDRTQVDPGAAAALLGSIGDEDPEIRRHVSFSLPFLLQQTALMRPPFAPQQASSSQGVVFDPEVRTALFAAFEDPEVIVRRNLLAAYAFLPYRPGADILLRLLADEDAQVRSAALNLAPGASLRSAFIAAASPLAKDPEPALRQQLARTIAQFRMAEGTRLLETLIADENEAVATEARLASLQLYPALPHAEALVDRLIAGALSPEQTRTLMNALTILGENSPPLLLRIFENGPVPARIEAVRVLVRHEQFFHRPDWIRRIAEEPSESVRREAVNNLQLHLNRATPALVDGLAASRHNEFRNLSVTLSGGLPPEDAFNALLELILDEEVDLRVRALRELHRRAFPGINRVLGRSLRDNEPAIQRAAVELLASQGRGEGIDILRQHLAEHPGTPLATLIQTELRRRGIQIN